ncbi:MAG TPA: hypothetical protein HPP69_08480, partial [Deltaproteobacteria bacterium]|nr:hypothetical protein [Deltaproteobacteria bacterium]
GFAAIKAVRENRIVLVEEPLVSRPTLRMLEGVRFLAGTIYPQLLLAEKTAGRVDGN